MNLGKYEPHPTKRAADVVADATLSSFPLRSQLPKPPHKADLYRGALSSLPPASLIKGEQFTVRSQYSTTLRGGRRGCFDSLAD